MTTTQNPVSLFDLRPADYDQRATGENPCAICGRELKPSERDRVWIEIDVDGYAIGGESPLSGGPKSLGCHQVGSSCKRKLAQVTESMMDPDTEGW